MTLPTDEQAGLLADAAEALGSTLLWIDKLIEAADIEPADTSITVKVISPTGETEVARVTLAESLIRAREVRARLIAGADGWQTMETAPRDGTMVLVFSPDGDDEDPSDSFLIGRWDPEAWGWTDAEARGSWVEARENRLNLEPTHWRPLPSPPRASGG